MDIDEQLRSVAREIAMRKRVYPKWVATNRMTEAEARREVAAMEAVYATLKTLRPHDRTLKDETDKGMRDNPGLYIVAISKSHEGTIVASEGGKLRALVCDPDPRSPDGWHPHVRVMNYLPCEHFGTVEGVTLDEIEPREG